MKIISLLLLCFWLNCTIAQTLQTAWTKSISGSLYEQSSNMVQAPCGDLYVVGFFQQDFGGLIAVGGEDGFVAKYNEQGQLIWVRQIAGTSTDRLNSVVVKNDEEIYLVGEFEGVYYYNNDSLICQNNLDVLVLKMDSSGLVQWAKNIGGQGYQSANDISLSPNGNLSIIGYYDNDLLWDTTQIQAVGLRDVFIATIDSLGNLLWLKTLGGPGFEEGRSIRVDNSNNVYITGTFRDALFLPNDTLMGFGSKDAYVAKYNDSGVLEWVKILGGPANDEGMDLCVDKNQDVLMVGWYDRSIQISQSIALQGVAEEDGFAAKFAPNGTALWAIPLAGNFDERVYGVDVDGANNIYFMGTLDSLMVLGGDTLTNRHLNRPTDIYLAKYNSAGTYKWATTLGHYYNDFCAGLVVKDASTLYLTGGFQDTTIFITDSLFSAGLFDVFVAKFEMDSTVGIIQIPNNAPTIITDVQLFPNPCFDVVTLAYNLEKDSDVQISLYDVLGKEQQMLFFRQQAKGNQQFQIKKENKQGIYIVSLEAGANRWLGKLVFE